MKHPTAVPNHATLKPEIKMNTTAEQLAPVDLLSEVAAAIEDAARLPLADLLDLGDRVESALSESRDRAEQAKTAALNPGLNFEAAQEARQEAERQEHEVMRYLYARRQIEDRLPDRASLHDETQRKARYDAALTAGNEAADLIRKEYARLARQIVNILERVEEVSAEIDRVNSDLPRNAKPLERPDGMARGFPDSGSRTAPIHDQVVHLAQMVLPDPKRRDGLLWPRNFVFFRDKGQLWPHGD